MERRGFVAKEILDRALTFRVCISVEMHIAVN